jgi:hypothetical protein
MHNPVFLQFPELLREHLLSDAIQGPKQLGKAPRSLKKLPQNQHLPSPFNDIERELRWTFQALPFHGRSSGLVWCRSGSL